MIKELRQRLDAKDISAPELTRQYLDRIKQCDGEINSYITVCEESALHDAKNAQKLIESNRQSTLTGIPIAVKDNICTKGIKTTCASKMLADFVPSYNATAVQRLIDTSAVILGKTNLDEFGMGSANDTSYFGAVKNPHDTKCIPGGSSGGSAAAVSARLCAAALGTDTGGSVRQPAALCGVTGFKPTYGAVSRFGLVAFASSLDTIGFLTDSAEDSAYLMNCVAGSDAFDSTAQKRYCNDYTELFGKSLKGAKIGIPKEFYSGDISEEVKISVLNAVDFFKNIGCEIIETSFKYLDFCSDTYKVISCAEASSNLSRYDGIKYGVAADCRDSFEKMLSSSRSKGFGDEVKKRILFGTYVLSEDNNDALFNKAQALRERIKEEYRSIFSRCDLILTPSVPYPARDFSDCRDINYDRLAVSASLAGLPSVSTPCGFAKASMPIGLMITGKPFADSYVLAAADLFEREYFGR